MYPLIIILPDILLPALSNPNSNLRGIQQTVKTVPQATRKPLVNTQREIRRQRQKLTTLDFVPRQRRRGHPLSGIPNTSSAPSTRKIGFRAFDLLLQPTLPPFFNHHPSPRIYLDTHRI